MQDATQIFLLSFVCNAVAFICSNCLKSYERTLGIGYFGICWQLIFFSFNRIRGKKNPSRLMLVYRSSIVNWERERNQDTEKLVRLIEELNVKNAVFTNICYSSPMSETNSRTAVPNKTQFNVLLQ